MSAAHECAVRVINVIFVVVGTIMGTCRASVADTFVIWKSAFSSDTGATKVVTWSVLATRNALHLINGNCRIVSFPTWVLVSPVLPLHHADYAPGHATSKVPGPDACIMSFSTSELNMFAVAPLRKASAFEILEVVLQFSSLRSNSVGLLTGSP